ncbi:hypothetical protein Cpin_3564 [Chitinophaga pinensis DSM 2588]|uniref:Uncharacterized protein n=1 Tax=Chitinophaga pinensis (strain ATCC 43595 / DSM 2588 / LMG 13176 / NBRC 15968 / NCIMB 11800 / UQM 2034) TaxID=485918 RepID=A0A979GQ26_CHIPD|nr:hypothetical protein Cpin_3564 [Chitinophaga pinensis DSM 2588]
MEVMLFLTLLAQHLQNFTYPVSFTDLKSDYTIERRCENLYLQACFKH